VILTGHGLAARRRYRRIAEGATTWLTEWPTKRIAE
jgi:hypothetical protein